MTLPVVEAAMADLRTAHRDLLRVVDSLSDAQWELYVPYGDWRIRDLIAHCIGDMSPRGVGLILAGVLTPQFIADTSKYYDVRARNAAVIATRRDLSREDLRQMLFSCHDALYNAAMKLREEHLPVLEYAVPMGTEFNLKVEDWLWSGYHDRQHADDIHRALEIDWRPESLSFLPEIEETFRLMTRGREGLLRVAYSVAEEAWQEESPAAPGWSFADIFAHVTANDKRAQTRFRALLGERDEAELEALEDEDGWNQRAVEARRGRTFQELTAELDANRHETIGLLSRLRPEHLSTRMPLAFGETATPTEYIAMFSGHESRHAAQLIPATRARRFR
jgi:hypothetical protein